MRNLDRTQFMFQDKQYSREYAQTLAENLHSYSPEHVLDGKFISGDFMADKVKELFKYFTPDNFRYYVASNTFKGPWNKRVKYYDTDYSEHKIPKRKLDKWRNVVKVWDFFMLCLGYRSCKDILHDICLCIDKPCLGSPFILGSRQEKLMLRRAYNPPQLGLAQ